MLTVRGSNVFIRIGKPIYILPDHFYFVGNVC